MEKQDRKFDINDRLINLAVAIIRVCENVNNSKAVTHMFGQLVRSGTSPSLNYGEAQNAESRADFIKSVETAKTNNQAK